MNILKSLNLFKKDIKKNFNYSTPSVYAFADVMGNIIGTPRLSSFENEIYNNVSIQTVINKQLGINTQTQLKLYETKQGKDTETKNEGANKLLEALLNPNTAPGLLSWNDIIRYFYQRYFTNGIGALVFTYDGDFESESRYTPIYEGMNAEEKQSAMRSNIRLMQQLEIQNIEPAKYVAYKEIGNGISIYYDISFYNNTGYTIKFTQDINLEGFYTARVNGKFYLAFIFQNYNFQHARHESFLNHIKPSIILENSINTTLEMFYKNACMPSSIIEAKPSFNTPEFIQGFNDYFGSGNENREKFDRQMQQIESDLKASINSGKPIMPKNPYVSFNVIPLQISPDSKNATELKAMAKNDIYSFFAGASRSAYEGTNEYASNAEPKLKELYDGSIGFLKSNFIDELNRFLYSYLSTFKIAPPTQIKNFYFSLDTSSIEFYKERQKTIYSQDYKNGEITLNEVRAKKAMLDEVNYGDFVDLPNGDKTFQELGKTNTQL